jgi:hypothetical protein
MVALIVGMLLCVGLALAVVALVAIPARREGRDLLTPKGEEVMAMARERTQDAFDKTGEVLAATKDKVTETVASAAPGGATAGASAATSPAQPKGDGGDEVTARRAS